jgi:hypothetical protein
MTISVPLLIMVLLATPPASMVWLALVSSSTPVAVPETSW